jgi:CHAT domain-containing protein
MARTFGDRALLISILLLLALRAPAAAVSPADPYHQARTFYDRGDWSALIKVADAALAEPATTPSDDFLKLRILRGAARLVTGDRDGADADVSPELPPRLQQSEEAVIRLRILGIRAFQKMAANKAHGDEAKVYLDAAQKLAMTRHPRLAAEVVFARVNMKGLYEPAQREHFARQAISLATKYPFPRAKVAALSTLARALGDQERFDEAIPVAVAAIKAAKANQFGILQMQNEGHLGWFYRALRNDELAEQYVRNAIATAAKLGRKTDLLAWTLNLGDVHAFRHDYPAAEAAYRQGLELAKETSDAARRGLALEDLAGIHLERGQHGEARRLNGEAIAAKQEANDLSGILSSQVLGARIDRETKQFDAANRTLQDVLSQKDLTPSTRFNAEAELTQLAIARHDGAEAKRHFERAVETMSEAGKELHEDLKLSFTSVTAALYTAYVDFLADSSARDALRVAELSRARTLTEGLHVDVSRSEDLDPEAIARRAGVTILSYWLAPARSFLFVVTASGVKLFPLPPKDEIRKAIEGYQKDLAGSRGTLEESRTRGSRLYGMLVGPGIPAIQGKRLVVIPDGSLTGFNFETLVVPSPKPRFWIEDVTIETANALPFVAARHSDPSDGTMLLIGNAPPAGSLYPKLQHAGAEVKGVAGHFKRRTVLVEGGATPEAYEKAGPETYTFIHFVAHGEATRERPLDSAVVLGPGRDGNYKLYARRIVDHKIHARLVTISSCHGAGRRAFQGEGLVGLAWAFLRAGAHEVVAALWEVDDAATPELMDQMYGAIRAGQSPAQALRTAKLKLLKSGTPRRSARYWAPFVLYSGS